MKEEVIERFDKIDIKHFSALQEENKTIIFFLIFSFLGLCLGFSKGELLGGIITLQGGPKGSLWDPIPRGPITHITIHKPHFYALFMKIGQFCELLGW